MHIRHEHVGSKLSCRMCVPISSILYKLSIYLCIVEVEGHRCELRPN